MLREMGCFDQVGERSGFHKGIFGTTLHGLTSTTLKVPWVRVPGAVNTSMELFFN